MTADFRDADLPGTPPAAVSKSGARKRLGHRIGGGWLMGPFIGRRDLFLQPGARRSTNTAAE